MCTCVFSADHEALVVKASGLAAGKGVIVAGSKGEACQAAQDILQVGNFILSISIFPCSIFGAGNVSDAGISSLVSFSVYSLVYLNTRLQRLGGPAVLSDTYTCFNCDWKSEFYFYVSILLLQECLTITILYIIVG